jgi:hypothetical protein
MTIKLVYNSLLTNELNPSSLTKELEGFPISFEFYDENIFSDKRKARQIKSSFGARLIPFVAVYENKKGIKGFYSEVNECNINNIVNYVKDKTSCDIFDSPSPNDIEDNGDKTDV